MGSWNHPNFSYPNLHLSELPKKMIFIDIFCCALNGKYSALYIKGRREGEGGKEEGGGGSIKYVCVRMWGSLGPGHSQILW